MKTCWNTLLKEAMKRRGETPAEILSSTLSEAELQREFDTDWGGEIQGQPFTVWTAHTVYFPLVYDGKEWVGSVARHPDGKPTQHQGGGVESL